MHEEQPKRNDIKHWCSFCGTRIDLGWNKRTHKCQGCGQEYLYVPNDGKMSRRKAWRLFVWGRDV